MTIIDNNLVQTFYKKRKPNTHKGDFGHAFLIVGSPNKMGAALIASKACLRTGVGLLTTNIAKEEKTSVTNFIPEAMLYFRENSIDFTPFNAVGIGPGLEQNEASQKIVYTSLLKVKENLVLDADALKNNFKKIISEKRTEIVITPHEGEFLQVLKDLKIKNKEKNNTQ